MLNNQSINLKLKFIDRKFIKRNPIPRREKSQRLIVGVLLKGWPISWPTGSTSWKATGLRYISILHGFLVSLKFIPPSLSLKPFPPSTLGKTRHVFAELRDFFSSFKRVGIDVKKCIPFTNISTYLLLLILTSYRILFVKIYILNR